MDRIARKILNMDALNTVEKENEMIEDAREKEIREQLLEAIWNKITDYDAHILDYEYKQHCKELVERGLEFIPVEKNGVAASWDELFASSVSEQAKNNTKSYNDQFKWHLFSFDLLKALKSADARAAINTQAKESIYLFFQYAEKAYLVKNASLLKAEDLDIDSDMDKADIYLFDPLEKWTYVKTHETMCGPYFYRKQ